MSKRVIWNPLAADRVEVPMRNREAGEVIVSDLTRGERLQIMLTEQELKALDDWRFSRRMPSRAAAVRELLKRGLAAEGFSLAAAGDQSSSFGVTDNAPDKRARADRAVRANGAAGDDGGASE